MAPKALHKTGETCPVARSLFLTRLFEGPTAAAAACWGQGSRCHALQPRARVLWVHS